MYRILSTSRNVRLLLERNSILAVAGFSVISPRYPEQTPLLAAQEQVDAVIIGHSVDPFVRKSIIRDLRRVCPGCVICFVYAAPETRERVWRTPRWMSLKAPRHWYDSCKSGYQKQQSILGDSQHVNN
jgi:hypothetical protein